MAYDTVSMTPGSPGSAAARGLSEEALKAQAEDHGFKAFGDDGFTFHDLIDMVNPLHHIPVVGTLYRDMTGDELDPASRIVGGALFGGPIGGGLALANVFIEHETGQDVGEHVMTAFFDEEEVLDGTVLTENQPEPTPWTQPDQPWHVAALNGFHAANAEADAAMGLDRGDSAVLAAADPSANFDGDPENQNPTTAWYETVIAGFDDAELQAGLTAVADKTPSNRLEAAQEIGLGARAYGVNVPAMEGGWFTEVMLGALQKYETAAMLSDPAKQPGAKTVSMVR